ncbi:centrosomal protein of 104 kDa-like isoform X2 [Rhizophagus clarus]|uniref:Centrosomal protein of 104 kDa-like isoform X2 n=1 Tax=Rhizophagus clarus TaxID=94130 RepID=A0A8H3LPB0_9GLOM|nr:centrosomal protein of 104 kDa-like isoform X2 [Rhizophagus clarus]
MIEQEQKSSVPLSSQISPSQEKPSQEEDESSPSYTTEVVLTTDTTETITADNQEQVSPIVEETSESEKVVEGTSESEKVVETSESEIAVEKTSESELIVESEKVTEKTSESEQVAKEISESEQVKENNTYNEQQEEKGVNSKETEYNSSVTNENIENPLNIESAQLEISNILNNTTNTENGQETKESSPLLTYVVDNNLDSLAHSSMPSQEGTATMSLQHLEYDIVHATGWDDNYPPHQLLPMDNKNSSNDGSIKLGKGWQSKRSCKYPQEIILQVSCGVARIRKLQILSHHYKIATKLEIYVGSVQQRKEMMGMEDKYTGGSNNEKGTLSSLSWDKLPKMIDNDGINPDEEESSEDNEYEIVKPNDKPYILFRRLGYCALDSNERANYKARELKSVRLDTEGEYIRLVARRCHSNHLNTYNQVGIVGITVMGEPADYLLAGESQKIPIEHSDEVPNNTTALPNNNQTKNNNPVTASDFLSNGEETEKLLAAFGRAKQSAVKVEDFNLAKVLKYCTELVKKTSDEVRNFEELKKKAVEEEDFDNADKYKRDIEEIRAEVRVILSDEGLDLDESGEVIISDPSLLDIIGLADDVENESSNVTGVPSGNEHQLQQNHLHATSAYIPKSRSASNASLDRSGARAPEPIFPSMTKSRTSSDASLNRFLDIQKEEEYPPKDEFNEDGPILSDLARSAFKLSIPYFGENVILRLLSKNHTLKESAITDVMKRIDIDGEGSNVGNIDKIALIKATYQVMQEALDDNNEELSLQILILWKKILRFCSHYQIPNMSTWKFVDSSYELLFSKIADTNERVKQNSVDLFILLAKTYRTPTQSVLSLVLKPAKTSSQSLKRAKPTVELVIRLVEEFGVVMIPKGKFDKDNKLSLDAVMDLAVSYLNNSHTDVQDSAVKLVFEVIKRIGRVEVAQYLTDVQPSSLESILNLLVEWEETTGRVAGDPSPPPSPKSGYAEENFEVNEELLQKPLAKRGTVNRIEQQLMEVRQLVNNTNNIMKEEHDGYANVTKSYHQNEIDEEELALAAEEARLAAELEAEEEQLRLEELNQSQAQKDKAAAANKKTPAARGSKSTAPSKAAPAKKSKDDSKAASSKKTSTSKSSAASSKAKPESRRGSTDDKPTKGGKKSSANTTQNKVTAEPEKITDEPDESKGDRNCIFCDEQDDRFTEDNLVTHYWNDCPVLTNCRLCNIILEISTLDDHMLNDCDKSKFVKQCPRCREVIEADDYLEHMAKQACMVIRPDIVRCPLCKTVVKPATEQGWKSHLLDENGCTKNRRKSRQPAATSMVKEMEAAATAETREKKSSSATKSSATSKAPTRKPTATSKDKPKKASTTKVSKVKK